MSHNIKRENSGKMTDDSIESPGEGRFDEFNPKLECKKFQSKGSKPSK